MGLTPPHRVGVASLALLLPALMASRAGAQCACSASTCPADRLPFFSSSVPPQLAPNARILARLDQYAPETVALATSDGAPVPFTLEPAGDAAGSAFWLVPTEPLAPGSYAVSAALRGSPTAVTPQTFSVSSDDDTTPPEVHGLRAEAPPGNRYCSDLIGGWIGWDSWGATDVQRSVLNAEVELLREDVMIARVFPAQLTTRGSLELGTATEPGCFGSAHAAGLVEGEQLTARVRIWDAAGNATPFESTTFTVTRASGRPVCERSCSAAPWGRTNAAGVGASLALILAAFLGRRSRRAVRGQAATLGAR